MGGICGDGRDADIVVTGKDAGFWILLILEMQNAGDYEPVFIALARIPASSL
jgi:hypothetical protein